MTYKINKTDGSLLTEIVDGLIDQTASDVTLIGKNVANYGEFINENFVKLLENFSNTTPPSNPMTGQVWFDSAESRLKVYDGYGFKIGAGPIVQGTNPMTMVQGDLWINNVENQLFFYDGQDLSLAGPIYSQTQGKSGFTVETIVDTTGISRTVVLLWVAKSLIGIFSKDTTIFSPREAIAGYSGTIGPGFNSGTISNMKFDTTVTSAMALLNSVGDIKTVDSFLSTEENDSTIGTLTIQNPVPLILGPSQNSEIRVSSSLIEIVSNTAGQDFRINVKNENGSVEVLRINNDGSTRITGSLQVDGDIITNTPIPLCLDITGLSDADIVVILSNIAPTVNYANNTTAKIHCTNRQTSTIVRSYKLFRIQSDVWQWVENTTI